MVNRKFMVQSCQNCGNGLDDGEIRSCSICQSELDKISQTQIELLKIAIQKIGRRR